MEILTWHKSYNIGAADIDRQHRDIFRLINRVHQALASETTTEKTGDILTQLMTDVRGHFADEEKVMERAAYPLLPKHRQKHQELMATLKPLMARCGENGNIVATRLLAFLKDWWQKHILEDDARIGRHLRTNGTQARGAEISQR
ncbi:MAG: hemerythrin family protein [Candidatus Zixiibacteriota bacterium]|nr:MAG: hemerythrin family protein [candidate division Zixibacteria bacterium]